MLDDLFRKTKAAPCIYWLPLTESQVSALHAQQWVELLITQETNMTDGVGPGRLRKGRDEAGE